LPRVAQNGRELAGNRKDLGIQKSEYGKEKLLSLSWQFCL